MFSLVIEKIVNYNEVSVIKIFKFVKVSMWFDPIIFEHGCITARLS